MKKLALLVGLVVLLGIGGSAAGPASTAGQGAVSLPSGGVPMAATAVPSVCNPCLYYSGDRSDGDAWLFNAIYEDWPPGHGLGFVDAWVYTPVRPDHDWVVTGLFANEVIAPADAVPLSISWEIRIGMSAGNGGSVYASGPASPMGWIPTGRTPFGVSEYSALAQLGAPVTLHQGVTYWINVLPEINRVSFSSPPAESTIDRGGDNHYGPPNVLNDSFFNSAYFDDYYEPTALNDAYNFSFGVLGTVALDCSTATAIPNVLWPPNHKLQTIALSGVTDPTGSPVTFTVIGVSQDEPPLGQGSGDRSPDATLATVPNTVNVRAERSGEGDGRVYQIGFTATAGDLTCTSTVTVGVPHDQHSGPATDSGQRYDSFGH